MPLVACGNGQAEIIRDPFHLSEVEFNFFRHEFFVTIIQDEFENQALECFGDVSRVISCFSVVEPISVNSNNTGKIAKQGEQGLVDRVHESTQWGPVTE